MSSCAIVTMDFLFQALLYFICALIMCCASFALPHPPRSLSHTHLSVYVWTRAFYASPESHHTHNYSYFPQIVRFFCALFSANRTICGRKRTKKSKIFWEIQILRSLFYKNTTFQLPFLRKIMLFSKQNSIFDLRFV